MKAPPDFGIDDSALTNLTVSNDLRSVREPEARILAELARHGYESDTAFAVKLAYEEAVTNAVKHGNCNDHSKNVHVRYYVDPERVVIAVRDEGCGFCPEDIPDPTADENLERPCGRGIMLIGAYMTKVRYSAAGNEVWMLKLNERPAARQTAPRP